MKVSYKGFTGILKELRECSRHTAINFDGSVSRDALYDLVIYDDAQQVTHSFAGVRLADVKFSSAAVSFS